MIKEKTQPIEDFFSDDVKDDIKTILAENNIKIPDSFKFSNRINIVIGSNGSGKTRLLRAIRDIYEKDSSVCIMYGYYPSLKDTYLYNNTEEMLPEYSLYQFLNTEEARFDDLLKAIEKYGPQFISGLFLVSSKSEQNMNNEIWKGLSEDFKSLTGKTLLYQNKKIYINDPGNVARPIEEAMKLFSPGEIMLLYMSVFLALHKNSKARKRVIILDEPESHLHPKALLSFIDMLQKNHKAETIWIATHSLFLIPEFKFDNIVYMKDGEVVKKKSNVYQELISSVLGDEKMKTKNFFSSLSQWQYCEFIAECFTNPTVIDTINPQDEQVRLFVEFLKSRTTESYKLKVLDFGGGSARLGTSLNLVEAENKPNIEYQIYDPKPEYKGDEFKVYTDLKSIEEKFDCIVMMNVLHEITPKQWCKTFYDISSLLKRSGYLIFVETSALSVGEMPNKNGYYILGKDEIKVLFNRRTPVTEIRIKKDQKSSCIVLKKETLLRINQESVTSSIVCLKEHSLREIKKIRGLEENHISNTESRRYAFWSQQYVNAKIYLDSLLEESAESESKTKEWNDIDVKTNINQQIVDEVKALLNSFEIVIASSQTVSLAKTHVQDALKYYEMFGNIPVDYRQNYWKDILELEKNNSSKKVIAILLKAASCMGDERCTNRLHNNGYDKYL